MGMRRISEKDKRRERGKTRVKGSRGSKKWEASMKERRGGRICIVGSRRSRRQEREIHVDIIRRC